MRGRLNVMQRQIRHWGYYHPYNAMMLWHLEGPLDADRLRAALETVPSLRTITGLSLSRQGDRYEYVGGQPFRVEVVDARREPERILRRTFEDHLNRPFVGPVRNPARFVLVDRGDTHYVGLSIDHVIGDLKTGEMILRRLVSRYRGLADPMGAEPFDYYPATYGHVFRRSFRPGRLVRAAARFPATWLGSRRFHRLRGTHLGGLWCTWRHAAAAPGTAERVKAFAVHHGGSSHDVFLAALVAACARHFPERLDHPHRRGLAVGAIADLRPLASVDLDRTIGVFLGFFAVGHPAPERLAFADLVRWTAGQSVVVRERELYFRNLVYSQVGALLWPYLDPRTQLRMYSKFLPVVGGLSTANIRAFGRRVRERVGLLDVIRGPSCGPALPMVALPTRVGDDLNLTLTFRPASVPEEKAEAILADYVECLSRLET